MRGRYGGDGDVRRGRGVGEVEAVGEPAVRGQRTAVDPPGVEPRCVGGGGRAGDGAGAGGEGVGPGVGGGRRGGGRQQARTAQPQRQDHGGPTPAPRRTPAPPHVCTPCVTASWAHPAPRAAAPSGQCAGPSERLRPDPSGAAPRTPPRATPQPHAKTPAAWCDRGLPKSGIGLTNPWARSQSPPSTGPARRDPPESGGTRGARRWRPVRPGAASSPRDLVFP